MTPTTHPEKKQAPASLFNLVIYAHEASRVEHFEELIQTILSKFPCRIIFIHAYGKEEDHFLVRSSRVLTGKGQEQTVCDRTVIEASKKQLPRVLSVLFPAINPDLPIYLLWGQSPFEEHLIFPALRPYAARVIIDSGCYDNLPLFCRQMETHLNLLKMDLMDLNWALLSSWRDLLSSLFDRPDKQLLLNSCKSIILTYNSTATERTWHPELRAIYLQGWLAACLGATFMKAEYFEQNLLLSYMGKKNPLVIALEPQPDFDHPAGTILGAAFSFINGDSYAILPKPALSQAIVHESSLDTCALPYTLPLPNVYAGTTFLNEILYQSVGDHYRKMLKMISNLTSYQ